MMEFFDSEEGKEKVRQYFDGIKQRENIANNQIERLKGKSPEYFIQFTKQVIEKYNSIEYNDRWYKRGIEPPQDLFWFLYEYAKKYGRECTEQEWEKLSSMFTSDLRFCEGYYFERMDGQGSVIDIRHHTNLEE